MADTAAHYNGVTNGTRAERARGTLYDLKKYHNTVKRDLLTTYGMYADKVLDLGCGRGGDMQKWADCCMCRVDGVDISEAEIQEARARYDTFRHARKPQCTFCIADVTRPLPSTYGMYNVVTAMFCLHYFFESKETLVAFMTNVASHLVLHGFFIGTCLNDVLVRACETSVLSIVPGDGFHKTSGYGRQYTYSLRDTVTEKHEASMGSVEYLVDFQELVAVAEQVGLRFKERTPFIPPTAYPGYEASRMCQTFVFIKQPE